MRSEISIFIQSRITPFLRFCLQEKKRVVFLSMICLAIFTFAMGHTWIVGKAYVWDEQGMLTALQLEEGTNALTLSLQVEAERNGESVRERQTLALQKEDDSAGDEDIDEEIREREEESLAEEVRQILIELADTESRSITLPETLADGTRLYWTRPYDPAPFGILLFIPLGMVYAYRTKAEKVKTARKKEVDEIRNGLPAFQNQLLLLLRSGLILQDVFERIAEGCKRQDRRDALGQMIIQIDHDCQESGMSLLPVLEHRARNLSVREFSRMVSLMADHQNKGVSLAEKLEAEREALWHQRKKLAEERGRAAETKLAFPLAMLLVVLVLVTAAPALLEM